MLTYSLYIHCPPPSKSLKNILIYYYAHYEFVRQHCRCHSTRNTPEYLQMQQMLHSTAWLDSSRNCPIVTKMTAALVLTLVWHWKAFEKQNYLHRLPLMVRDYRDTIIPSSTVMILYATSPPDFQRQLDWTLLTGRQRSTDPQHGFRIQRSLSRPRKADVPHFHNIIMKFNSHLTPISCCRQECYKVAWKND